MLFFDIKRFIALVRSFIVSLSARAYFSFIRSRLLLFAELIYDALPNLGKTFKVFPLPEGVSEVDMEGTSILCFPSTVVRFGGNLSIFAKSLSEESILIFTVNLGSEFSLQSSAFSYVLEVSNLMFLFLTHNESAFKRRYSSFLQLAEATKSFFYLAGYIFKGVTEVQQGHE